MELILKVAMKVRIHLGIYNNILAISTSPENGWCSIIVPIPNHQVESLDSTCKMVRRWPATTKMQIYICFLMILIFWMFERFHLDSKGIAISK